MAWKVYTHASDGTLVTLVEPQGAERKVRTGRENTYTVEDRETGRFASAARAAKLGTEPFHYHDLGMAAAECSRRILADQSSGEETLKG